MHHQLQTLDSTSVITFSTERPQMLVPRSFIAQNAPTESCRCTIRIPWYHQNPAYTHRILFALTAWNWLLILLYQVDFWPLLRQPFFPCEVTENHFVMIFIMIFVTIIGILWPFFTFWTTLYVQNIKNITNENVFPLSALANLTVVKTRFPKKRIIIQETCGWFAAPNAASRNRCKAWNSPVGYPRRNGYLA